MSRELGLGSSREVPGDHFTPPIIYRPHCQGLGGSAEVPLTSNAISSYYCSNNYTDLVLNMGVSSNTSSM